ncbi:hypothetical protein [Brevundimonas sp.]
MLGVLAFLLLTSQAVGEVLQAEDVVVRADRRESMMCTTTLPMESVAVSTLVVCTVDGEGAATDCNTDDATLTAPQRRVALCMARLARIEGRDGQDVRGRSVALPISYRFTVEDGTAGGMR